MNRLQKIWANATFRPDALVLGSLMALTLFSGCASIVGSERQTLPINSTPPDAEILIVDEAGWTTYRGRTPDRVELGKSDGRYWGGKQYSIAISKRGYLTQRVKVGTHPNALYLGGNLVFGGLIGWLIIDPPTGKMYELSSDGIEVTLQKRPDAAPPTATSVVDPPIIETPLPDTSSSADLRPPPTNAVGALPSTAMVAAPPANTAETKSPAPVPQPTSLTPPEAPAMTTPPPPLLAAEPTPPAPIAAPAITPPAAPPVSSGDPVPPTTPQTPPPYWPPPPPLPVSPSTVLPGPIPYA